MENRVAYLEENLETLGVQLSVIQDFLQKQFGSRFLDYAVNRGVYIDKNLPSTSKTYYNSELPVKTVPLGKSLQNPPIRIQDILSGDNEEQEDEYYGGGYEEDGREEDGAYEEDIPTGDHSDDPLAFVETVDDQQNSYDYGDDYYQNEDPSGLVIVNCRTENGVVRIPSPLHTTVRPPSSKTYSKNAVINKPAARKRLGTSSGGPLAKKLPPKVNAQQVGQNVLMEDMSSMDDILTGIDDGQGDPDSEDLREFYTVLPDKSVQCKICNKVLKAGWHKYGRHYRTHTGEKPFSCHYCHERFARKDNMHNHVKSKHESLKIKKPPSNNGVSYSDMGNLSNDYLDFDMH